jgi:excisionase family DNA binding protein
MSVHTMYLDIKELSGYLKIKPSTLYAWATRRKIPSIKIHGLIRFEKEAIDLWLETFKKKEQKSVPSIHPPVKDQPTIDEFIEKAKREVYNSNRRETRLRSAQEKEKEDGAV